jgi:hypothetical protein
MFQIGGLVILSKMNLGSIMGAFGWNTTLYSSFGLNAGSIVMYTLGILFGENTVPPELFYWWN